MRLPSPGNLLERQGRGWGGQLWLNMGTLLKDFLSSELPLDTSIARPYPPEGQDPAPPTSGQAPSLPTRKPALPSRPSLPIASETLPWDQLGPNPDTMDPIPNCDSNQNSPPKKLKLALGSLGPAARLQESILPASSPPLTPGTGFTSQWIGKSPSVFRTLSLPTSEPA
ncbi:hypothetical protein Cadr_000004128 [Camelus dromedarius]|uniref:Uncharacterized protein n=1 Tax=Camelus dromedarius TaxID=9838 RepID=A0A5N4ED25_CAMDR|nr:hypothetical protein Cadr_000004128 [Camelus dromedarius]